MDYIYNNQSPIGEITLGSDGSTLIGLWFKNEKYFADTLSDEYTEKYLPIFQETIKWLDIYFSGDIPNFTPPILMRGSKFRKAVWTLLLNIPYGKVVTYKDIALKIAHERAISKMSAQAVGGAVGHNPISIIIPCHRVIGSNNSLTGYAGGLDKKLYLLNSEGVDTSNLFMPK